MSGATASPFLTVLMPVYNGQLFIAQALDSIVAQGSDAIEVIVVDDASNDETVAIATQYQDRLRLTVVRQERAANWLVGTNRALAMAHGEFIGVLHQDDYWLADRVSKLHAVALSHPEAGMIAHSSRYVDDRQRFLGSWTCPLSEGYHSPSELLPKLLVQNFFAMPAPIVRRDIAREAGGFDEALWYAADWDFWLKVCARTPVYYLPEPLAAFRLHRGSQTLTGSRDSFAFRQQLETCLHRHTSRAEVQQCFTQHDLQVARYSVDVNVALAQTAHGQPVHRWRLLRRFLALGPRGWVQYLRNSRVRERVTARVRL